MSDDFEECFRKCPDCSEVMVKDEEGWWCNTCSYISTEELERWIK